jgi:hypothetical protein
MSNQSNDLNLIVGNIVSFKKFIDMVLDDVKSGQYSIEILKRLSDHAEHFFSTMPDLPENEEDKKLKPRTVEVDESDQESDSDDDLPSVSFMKKFIKGNSSDKESDTEDEEESDKEDDENIGKDKNDFEEQFDKLDLLMKSTNVFDTSSNQPSKKEDRKEKFIENFLNNSVEIKCHYMKDKMNRINSNINMYCQSCYTF